MDEGLTLQTAMENLVTWHSVNLSAGGTNSLELLRQYIATNLPSGIVAIETNYVDFAGGVEATSTNPVLLKVTLANGLNEAVTRLFARPLREAAP